MLVAYYEMPDAQACALKGAITVRNAKGEQVGRSIAHHHCWQSQQVGVNAKNEPIYDLVKFRPATTGQIELYEGAAMGDLFWDTKGSHPIHLTSEPEVVPDFVSSRKP